MPQQSDLTFPLTCLRSERRTVLVNQQNVKVVIDDNWRTAGDVDVGYGDWSGFTFFKLLGGPTSSTQMAKETMAEALRITPQGEMMKTP